LAQFIGRDIAMTRIGGLLLLDLLYAALFAAALVMFVARLVADIRRIEILEARRANGTVAVGNVVPLARGETPRPRPPLRSHSQESAGDRGASAPASRNRPFPL